MLAGRATPGLPFSSSSVSRITTPYSAGLVMQGLCAQSLRLFCGQERAPQMSNCGASSPPRASRHSGSLKIVVWPSSCPSSTKRALRRFPAVMARETTCVIHASPARRLIPLTWMRAPPLMRVHTASTTMFQWMRVILSRRCQSTHSPPYASHSPLPASPRELPWTHGRMRHPSTRSSSPVAMDSSHPQQGHRLPKRSRETHTQGMWQASALWPPLRRPPHRCRCCHPGDSPLQVTRRGELRRLHLCPGAKLELHLLMIQSATRRQSLP